MDHKLKHLEFIQTVIARLSSNSFLLKGWAVTLVSALFALGVKDANKQFILLAYFPIITFWLLNGYFLSQERRFRALYNQVRALPPGQIDFSLDTEQFNIDRNRWEQAFFCRVLLLFYLTLAVAVLIVWFVI
ncbi:MAG TPA: hypothetical protein VEP90_23970 [Methylomirabilota bacterium]|nr:hypothetical protein [Methylomirabilota bacterium]